jgi:hypothetical protein
VALALLFLAHPLRQPDALADVLSIPGGLMPISPAKPMAISCAMLAVPKLAPAAAPDNNGAPFWLSGLFLQKKPSANCIIQLYHTGFGYFANLVGQAAFTDSGYLVGHNVRGILEAISFRRFEANAECPSIYQLRCERAYRYAIALRYAIRCQYDHNRTR